MAVAIQRYDSAGAKVGTEVSIPYSRLTPSTVNNSSVAVLRDGSVVVAYETSLSVASEAISFQRFDSNGAQLSGETTVAPQISNSGPPTPGGAQLHAVALADGGFVVTWSTFSVNPVTFGVRVSKQRYDSQARPVGAVFVTGYSGRGGPASQSLVPDREGGYTLTMYGVNNSGQNFPVTTVIHFDAADVATTIADRKLGDSLLLPLAGDRFVLFTREFNLDANGFTRTDSPGILRQFLDSAGNPVGDTARIAAMPVDAIELADATFVVFTQASGGGFTAQRFDANGAPLGDPAAVDATVSDRGVAALIGGGLAFGWSATPPGSDLDVFTQRVLVQN